jgi:tetratricopeptide (TPR) repeat protein
MRHVLFAVGLVVVAVCGAAAGQRRSGMPALPSPPEVSVAADRLDRLHRWLKAVDRHEAGEQDEALTEVGGWTNAELRGLWIDVNVLWQLMRNVRLTRFVVQGEAQRAATEIRYTSFQHRQLMVFACAAAGMLADRNCLEIKASTNLDAELTRLAEHVSAERARAGDANYLARRGALLHSDIAIFEPRGPVEPFASPSTPPSVGPNTWRIDIADGRGVDAGLSAVHWDIARLALDQVRPSGSERPAPESDTMVRAWYRATAAWMQYREDHDTIHLDRARRIFPDDPDLLFLSGCQRETYAGPGIQSATRSVVLPPGLTMAIASERGELRQAEGFFRRALALRPDMGEAHLRLGRVLGRLGHHADAAGELRQALALIDDDELRYYGELFLGAEEEALGHFDAARAAFDKAAALFPSAQSPLLGLSELARRRGDRAGALGAIQKVFELPDGGDFNRDDPWWVYHVAQGRNADMLLDDVRAPFRRNAP